MDKVRFELGDTAPARDAGLRRLADRGEHRLGRTVGVRGSSARSSSQLAVADEKSPLHGAAEADVAAADGRLSLEG